MGNECIDGTLPFRLRHASRDPVISYDACIALRKRDENQNSVAVLLMGDAADGKLLQRGTVGDGATGRLRDETDANTGQTKDRGGDKKYRDLQ